MMNESCVQMVVSRGLGLFFADEIDENDEALYERLSPSVAPSVCLLSMEEDVVMPVNSSLVINVGVGVRQSMCCRAFALFECLSLSALFFRHRNRQVGVGCVGGAVGEAHRAREGVEHDESDADSNGRLRVLVDGVRWGGVCEGRGVGGGAGGGGEGVGYE